MAKQIALSKSAIENIFQLRANGMTFKQIADRYPCSDHYIRNIIARKLYKTVELDAGLVHGAQNVKVKHAKHKPRAKAVQTEDKYTPLSKLMEAQEALLVAYADCRSAGLSKAFIDLALDEVGTFE